MTSVNHPTRLSKAARELNVGISTIVEFLNKKGLDIDSNPNNKVPAEYYDLLVKEYSSDSAIKKESEKLIRTSSVRKETITLDGPPEDEEDDDVEEVEETKTVEVVEEVTAEVEDAPEVEEIVKEDKEEVQESVIVEEPVVTPKPVEEHVVEEVVEEVAETVAEEKVEESPKPAKEEDIEELKWMNPKAAHHALQNSYQSIAHVFKKYYSKLDQTKDYKEGNH